MGRSPIRRRPQPLAHHLLGGITLNLIAVSCSGALSILRKNGNQRGSFWMLVNAH
jgi:hypothetical protein